LMGLGLGPLIPLWGSIAGRGITGFGTRVEFSHSGFGI
jgi:hypothetical protein